MNFCFGYKNTKNIIKLNWWWNTDWLHHQSAILTGQQTFFRTIFLFPLSTNASGWCDVLVYFSWWHFVPVRSLILFSMAHLCICEHAIHLPDFVCVLLCTIFDDVCQYTKSPSVSLDRSIHLSLAPLPFATRIYANETETKLNRKQNATACNRNNATATHTRKKPNAEERNPKHEEQKWASQTIRNKNVDKIYLAPIIYCLSLRFFLFLDRSRCHGMDTPEIVVCAPNSIGFQGFKFRCINYLSLMPKF